MASGREIVGYRIYTKGNMSALVEIDAGGGFHIVGAEESAAILVDLEDMKALVNEWRLQESMSRYEWNRRERKQRCTVCGGAAGYCSACFPEPAPERATW
jgi:hypothetical protein